MKTSNYPTCLLCKENVGFEGNFKRDARVTHRIIPLNLNNQKYLNKIVPVLIEGKSDKEGNSDTLGQYGQGSKLLYTLISNAGIVLPLYRG